VSEVEIVELSPELLPIGAELLAAPAVWGLKEC